MYWGRRSSDYVGVFAGNLRAGRKCADSECDAKHRNVTGSCARDVPCGNNARSHDTGHDQRASEGG